MLFCFPAGNCCHGYQHQRGLGSALYLLPESLTSVSGKGNNESASISNGKLIQTHFPPQMASAQDARFGQKDSSDQNFDYMFKLLIIGNSSVGKTSFLFRYADDSFTSAFVSTVGIDFKVKTVFKNEKRIKLQIWVSDFELTSFFTLGLLDIQICRGKKSTLSGLHGSLEL